MLILAIPPLLSQEITIKRQVIAKLKSVAPKEFNSKIISIATGKGVGPGFPCPHWWAVRYDSRVLKTVVLTEFRHE